MKLQAVKRTADKKSEAKKLRREGSIPAILYSKGDKGEPVVIMESEFSALLRSLQPGSLSNTVLTLSLDGKDRSVIVKGIQYHPTTYNVQHLDFEELHQDRKVRLRIPIRLVGARDCIGVQQGGVLRTVIRQLNVECLPKDIPSEFQLHVETLEIKAKRRLKDIAMPANVRPLANLHEVAVVVAKR